MCAGLCRGRKTGREGFAFGREAQRVSEPALVEVRVICTFLCMYISMCVAPACSQDVLFWCVAYVWKELLMQ